MYSAAEMMMKAQVEAMKMMNPARYKEVVERMGGLERDAQVELLREEARKRGADLDALAERWGVKL